VIASIVALAIPLLSPNPVYAALTPHAPIYINGNSGFTKPDPVNGGGSGTENDPYIIENWIISPENVTGIEILNTTAYFVVRNCLIANFYYGIYLQNVVNGRIVNCTCDNNDDGIYIYSSDNNLVANNLVENNWNQYGVLLWYSNNNLISNNLVENNYYGILLALSNNNFVKNNLVENNTLGIGLAESTNNTILGNTVENNLWGIILQTSDNNIIENNTVDNNYYNGINLNSSSNNNTIENNTCSNNQNESIYLTHSSGNRVYHNNFIKNTTQAYDDGSNYWDNGYPSGGNYWSDYTGVDNYKGENQDIPGSDGIGDTPYIIPGDSNRDCYPLMSPWAPIVRGVEVSISPVENSGPPGTIVTFTVTVTNTGTDRDTFSLGAIDTEGWGPTLSITSTTLDGGASRTGIRLIIKIPDDAAEGGSTTITVTATGTGYENSAICIAHAVAAPPPPPGIGWDALITATFSGGSDDAIFGVRADASSGFDIKYDIPEPPAPPEPPYVRAYFYYPGQTLDELHRSCLAPENVMEWPLRIEYADNIENITLTWSVENIPPEYSVLLYRGRNLVANMRAEDNYIFEASTGSYDFRIFVGKLLPFTLELTQGWNMISFPILTENMSPDSIFDGYYVLYRWDAENKRYVLHADSGSFVEPDPNVEVGVGYWVYVLEDENVNLLGFPVNWLTLNLRQGWDLIGPPYGGSSIVDPADDPDNSVIPWAFTWNAVERSYYMTQLLEAGKGYWIYTLRDCTLTLPAPKVAEATSLAYTVEMSSAATGTITSRFRVRNIGTANMDMRVDMTTAYGTMSYILSGSQHEGWVKPNGGWQSFSSFGLDFDELWNQQSGSFEQYTGYLSGWTGGDWEGTFGGYTYRIYDIQVNPSLPDSVFTPD